MSEEVPIPFTIEGEPNAGEPGLHPLTKERLARIERLDATTHSAHQRGLRYRFETPTRAFVEGIVAKDGSWIWYDIGLELQPWTCAQCKKRVPASGLHPTRDHDMAGEFVRDHAHKPGDLA